MSKSGHDNLISKITSCEASKKEKDSETAETSCVDDGQSSSRSTQVLPDHIVDLMRVQQSLQRERASQTVIYSSSRENRLNSSLRLNLNHCYNTFKSSVISSEDDIQLQFAPGKPHEFTNKEKEPMFVIVESSYVNNPVSRELLIENKNNNIEAICQKKFAVNIIIPDDVPSTSKDINKVTVTHLKESESQDELQMMDINLQSENTIECENDYDSNSIVLSYLKNKDAFINTEEVSENSLDAYIPSYPGSPRSLIYGPNNSSISFDNLDPKIKKAVEFLHDDYDLLMAAEVGDDAFIDSIIRKGTNIHQVDHVGRNALHLVVCTGNVRAMRLLLQAGINPNVKDKVGMTPLSICLMRRPSIKVAALLFDYGAKLISRSNPMDTGLFLQFVMMCKPTNEDKKILKLLVEKGALVNDPDAPGGRQALHFAAMSNNCKLIHILIDLGADLHAINHRNETPREVAQIFRCKEAEELLQILEDCDSYTDVISIAISLDN